MKARSRKNHSGSKPAAPAAPSRHEAAPPLSRGRRWLFRFIAVVVLPIVLLGGLELLLRLVGYGYRPDFYERVRVGSKDYLVNNENFSLRFFPPQLERWPGAIMMEAAKPPGTYRILILGESAARGEPEPPYAAARYLEALLDERFPGTRFEVVNLGITAINSHVILPIARDSVRCHADLWVIYMGNNEMVGPFGAATVFGTRAPPLRFVRLSLALQELRLGQLLVNVVRRLGPGDPHGSWGGMKMFLGNQLRADDPRRAMVYRNFERNLDDIVRVGLGSGAKVLLNTVAVNLKDCPPFASLTNSALSTGVRADFDKLYAAGCAAEAQSNFADATQLFERAAKLDPQFPELQYRWAACLLQSTNAVAAAAHFQTACDDDALPFRADSRINDLIRAAGARFAGDRLSLFDAAAALAKAAPAGICGEETFYEHVHFNFDGNFRLGRAWAEQVEKLLPPEIARGATNDWAPREVCDRRLALTDWNQCAVVEAVFDRLQRPPLSGQLNNWQRTEWLRAERQELRGRMNPATATQAVGVYEAALSRAPQDPWLHRVFAEFLESAGDLAHAEAEWAKIAGLLPFNCEAYYQAGRLLEGQQRWAEAEVQLRKSLALRPRLTEAWYELGNVHGSAGQFESALRDYERAAELEPSDPTYRAFVGKALSKLNRHPDAIAQFKRAIEMKPDLWEAHFALGDEYAATSNFSGALAEYEQVVRLNPGSIIARLNVGVMQARLGGFDQALAAFAEVLRQDPTNAQAREYYLRVQQWKQRAR